MPAAPLTVLPASARKHRAAFVVVVVALLLRLIFVLVIDPHPSLAGGDVNWYLDMGHDLVTTGTTIHALSTPPLYLMYVGAVQVLVPGSPSVGEHATYTEIQALRVLACGWGAALVLLVLVLGRRLFSARVGLLAAWVMAISPALIIEAGSLLSESLFMVLLLGGLLLYERGLAAPTFRVMVWAGIVLGLATLTRAVVVLLPVGLAVHLVLTQRARWKTWVLALLVPYAVVLSFWTIYNIVEWNRFVIGSDGFWGFLYQGAEGKESPLELDQGLGMTYGESGDVRQELMQERISASIRSDPAGWLAHRVKELAGAYLQPHNTTYYGGASIRDATSSWLRHDRTLGGLRDLTQIKAFWPKLALYLFHFAGLLLGVGGMLSGWRRWRDLLPLYGLIAYFTGVHVVLLALPRYLFPLYPVFWLFAAALLVDLWARRSGRGRSQGRVRAGFVGL